MSADNVSNKPEDIDTSDLSGSSPKSGYNLRDSPERKARRARRPIHQTSSPKNKPKSTDHVRTKSRRSPSSGSLNKSTAASTDEDSDSRDESINSSDSLSDDMHDKGDTKSTTSPAAKKSTKVLSTLESSTGLALKSEAVHEARSSQRGDTVCQWMQLLNKHKFTVFSCVMVIMAVQLYIGYMWFVAAEVPCEISDTPADKIKALGSEVIPGQSARFWRIIRSSIRSLERRPACLVLSPHLSDRKTQEAIKVLSSKMECILSGQNETLSISGSEIEGEGHRSELDTKLSEWFHSGRRVAVIHDVDRLSLDTAKVFYKFCDDNEDPQYPGTLLILTLNHNDDDNVRSKSWLDQKLRHHWSNDDDEITPLLSRVGNSWTEVNSTTV